MNVIEQVLGSLSARWILNETKAMRPNKRTFQSATGTVENDILFSRLFPALLGPCLPRVPHVLVRAECVCLRFRSATWALRVAKDDDERKKGLVCFSFNRFSFLMTTKPTSSGINHRSSIINHQSSTINHQPSIQSIINHQESGIMIVEFIQNKTIAR